MSKLSLSEIRQSIRHVTIPPHIQGHPRYIPSLFSQLNKPSFQATEASGLDSSIVQSAIISQLQLPESRPLSPSNPAILGVQTTMFAKCIRSFALDFSCWFRSGPAHNPESSTPDSWSQPALGGKIKVPLTVLLSFCCWGRKWRRSGKAAGLHTQTALSLPTLWL